MRTCFTKDLTSEIVKECHAQFNKLPKHGKPARRSNGQAEWTILSGIVMTTPSKSEPGVWNIECISIGTGSKCLPQGKQSPRGDLLNDCHAEILARRGFNKWCLNELQACVRDPQCTKNKFRFTGGEHGGPLFNFSQADTKFHLYVSQAPCGDATTASLAGIQSEESRNAFFKGKNQESADVGAKRPQEAMSAGVSDDSGHNKKVKIDDGLQEDDLGKSGCRHALDFRRGRLDYASVGVLRTKPGRVDSEPTLSMSCSDKMARWSILGLTSGLVAPFLAPIYLTSVITMELFDEEALERALSGRLKTCDCLDVTSEKQYRPHPVIVCSTDIPFEYSKDKVTMVDQNLNKEELSSIPMPVASAASISWISGSLGSEVLVNGCKAGASAKKQIPPKSRSQICKMGMLQSAVALWTTVSETHGVPMPLEPATAPYSAWKGLSEAYVKTREQLHDTVLKNWARSNDELEQFTLSS